jgi:enoyl-CoA hydratase
MTLLNETSNGNIDVLTLDFEPMNTLDFETVQALDARFGQQPNDRALILTGQGTCFSAGVNVHSFVSYTDTQRAEFFKAITKMVTSLCKIQAPVVGAINGHAIGGGFVLALCCDYRIVSQGKHKFGLTEAKAGVPFPEGALSVIQHELPLSLLKNLALTSQLVGVDELAASGVFGDSVHHTVLIESAIQLAEDMLQQPVFTQVKKQLRRDLIDDLLTKAPKNGVEAML